MKVAAAKEQLLDAVQIVQRAVSVRNPLPILSGIKFEAVKIRYFLLPQILIWVYAALLKRK
jgi:DNA polymerase III sliding clamp (beta) subunit (PCNA family)